MRHRVFIALNLPEDIEKQLASYQYLWSELPVKWTEPENLHITLDFLGYVSDEELLEVLQNAKELAQKHKSFTIVLNKICYGPPNKIPPRMIWAVGNKIQEFNIVPHITLGRIKTWAWKQIEPEERPEVSKEINLTFEVNSIEVMESVLKRGGPQYEVLESYPLKEI